MLITLCYVYLWLRYRSSYALLIRSCVRQFHRTSSFTFCTQHQEEGKKVRSGTQQVPGEQNVCLQVGNKAFLIDSGQRFEDWNKWNLLLGAPSDKDLEDRRIAFITESVSLPSDTLSAASHYSKKARILSEFCLPLALCHGNSSQLLAEASVDNFSELGIAFMEDRLQMDNGSLLQRITSVYLTESPANKVVDSIDRSPDLDQRKAALELSLVSEGAAEKKMGVAESTEMQNSDNVNERLEPRQPAEASGEHLHLHLSSCHECLELENCTIESVKFASAENIPDLPEDFASLEDSPDVSFHQETSNLNISGKPPNVLVYNSSSDPDRFEQVKSVLLQCFDSCRYVVYPLLEEQVLRDPWMDNCLLLVLVGEKPIQCSLHKLLISYMEKGGRILGLSSPFTIGNMVLKRKNELQGLVQDLVFNRPNSSEISLSVLTSGFVFEDCSEEPSDQVEEWGHLNNDNQDLMMVRQKYGDDGGEAVLCQVRLEVAPESLMDHDKGTFDSLKLSNSQRHEVLTQILISLGLQCGASASPSLTPVYLLSAHKEKYCDVLQWIESVAKNGLVKSSKMSLKVFDSPQYDIDITPSLSPLITGQEDVICEDFSLEMYRENLRTETLGKTVLFSEVTTSTFHLLDGLMFHQPKEMGLIAIAAQQTQGKGRGGNVWLSPKGCALMTLLVSIPLASPLGHRIAFVQHLMSLAVVEAVRSMPGYEDIEMKVKWPNDIYYSNLMKLGGVLVNSTLMGNTFHILIGCGFNVSNSNPTICINDLISEHNKRYKTNIEPLRVDSLIARSVTTLEALINTFQLIGPEGVLPMYYKYWVHSGQQVRLGGEDGPLAWIVGVDDSGFLQVLQEGKDVITVHPDGNSFDMIRNLIIPKR
ncbi:biotin--protein ligase [Hyperolius riggenbachi]|uniref:biotin--protein ligase n=1 Tax=Hyperolius riggenbachi TaxID=752182 RepID=UPI0035A2805A